MLLKHNMGTPHMELQRLIDMHTQGTPLSDGNYSLVAEIAAKKNDGVGMCAREECVWVGGCGCGGIATLL